MISPILTKLYKLILERKIRLWIKSHRKSTKVQANFKRHHSILDHLVTPNIIVEEFSNNKKKNIMLFS